MAVSLAAVQPAVAKTVYVKPMGNNAKDGLTWATAKQTVAAGLTLAAAGDEIWVAAGTYVERITLKAGVALYGGFTGTEATLDQRNWSVNVTVLDGSSATVVVSPTGATSSTRIDGFTIRKGSAYASSGGGIYCSQSSPSIINNTIQECGAGDHGGGIYCNQSSPTITRNLFINNNPSDDGGAIYCYKSSPLIETNTFKSNRAGGNGGAIVCSTQSDPMITGNLILGNSASLCGGALYLYQSNPTVISNVISGNRSSKDGGGIYCSSSSPLLANNTMIRNDALEDGGAIHCYLSSPNIVNTIIAFNSSGICRESTGMPFLRNNCLYANTGYAYSGITDPTGTDGNIVADPVIAGAAYGNTHIQPDSPCRNAGANDVVQAGWQDIDGQARIQDDHADIGADESDGTVWSDGPNLIVRVSPTGDDLNDGSSWAKCKKTIQAGITAASAASASGGEVWVKAGTYVERITLQGYAHVYGGFAGTETSRADRTFTANVTVLDGYRGKVVTASALGSQPCTIDGFTIRNGEAYGSNGGGIYCYQSSPRISNNVITQNAAGDYGAGIYCQDGSPVIVSNTITQNVGDNNGGGICCYNGSPVICNNRITGNRINDYGGGIYLYRSTATICNNLIVGNRCTNQGGGIYCQECSPLIANNTIASNTASAGGALYSRDASPTVFNTILAFNSSGFCQYGTGAVVLQYNCAYGNTQYNYSGIANPTGTGGNLSADPRFLQMPSPGADGTWSSADDNYGNVRLNRGSPCIDAGSNSRVPVDHAELDNDGDSTEPLPFDLDNAERFMDDSTVADIGEGGAPVVDIGAYEMRDKIQEVPAEYPTIQEAIDAAWPGDEVVLQNGTYSGEGNRELDFRGKAIMVRSASGDPNSCVIDCAEGGRGFRFFRGEGPESTIRGLSIINGTADRGGAVSCENSSSPTIVECVMRANQADEGGALFCDSGAATLISCQILWNSARDGGGISAVWFSEPKLIRCVVADNFASFGGGLHCWAGSPRLTNCTLHGNSAFDGGAVCAFGGQTVLVNAVITLNGAIRGGSFSGYETRVTMTNCTVFANTADAGAAMAFDSYDQASPSSATLSNCILRNGTDQIANDDASDLAIRYSNVEGGAPGDGNIDLAPLFIDIDGPDDNPGTWADNDYRLSPGSGCIDSGDNAAVPVDATDLDGDGNTSEPLPLDRADSPRFMDDSATQDTGLGGLPIVDMGAYETRDSMLIVPGEYATIQAALDVALPGEQVVLLDGVFTGEGNRNLDFGGKRLRLKSMSGDPATCVIDCQGGARGLQFTSGENADSAVEAITIKNGSADLGGGIYCRSSSPTISRCVIRDSTAGAEGGGVYCVSGRPTLAGCTIESNSAGSGNGGGVCCREADASLETCTIRMNSANAGSGGGVYCYRSSPTMADCTLSANYGKVDGGAMCCDESHPTLTACVLTGNSVLGKGGGLHCSLTDATLTDCTISDNVSGGTSPEHGGGGVCCLSSTPSMLNTVIRNNRAAGGGGLYTLDSSPSLVNVEITGNSATGEHYTHGGGGLHCENGSPFLVNCTIHDNQAKFWGGGVQCITAAPLLVRCQIVRNSVHYGAGGGLYCIGPQSEPMLISCILGANTAYSGGGMYCDQSDPFVANSAITGNKAIYEGGAVRMNRSTAVFASCTLAGNAGTLGPALAFDSQPVSASTVSMSNCIVWNGPNQVWNHDASTLSATYCDIQGGWTGAGNIDADPRFVDPDGPDNDPNTWDDNQYDLSAGSPCVDAGNNNDVVADFADLDGNGDTLEPIPFDLSGLARFFDDPVSVDSGVGPLPIVDIGAYESHQARSCDLDHDGDVDEDDLALFETCGTGPGIFYPPPGLPDCPLEPGPRGYLPADFDEDRDVDSTDFAVLQRQFSRPVQLSHTN